MPPSVVDGRLPDPLEHPDACGSVRNSQLKLQPIHAPYISARVAATSVYYSYGSGEGCLFAEPQPEILKTIAISDPKKKSSASKHCSLAPLASCQQLCASR